jgi:hypothetical protein
MLVFRAMFLSALIIVPTVAVSLDIRDMQTAINSRMCPVDHSRASANTVQQDCPQNCGNPANNTFNSACDREKFECITRHNAEVETAKQYNQFLSECEQSSRANQSPSESRRTTSGDRSDDIAARIAAQTKKAADAPAAVDAYKKQIQQEQSNAINQRDSELAAARKDVAAREQAVRENSAKIQRQIDADRANDPPPIIPSIRPTSPIYPDFRFHYDEGFEQDRSNGRSAILRADECKQTSAGYACFSRADSNFHRDKCYDVREFAYPNEAFHGVGDGRTLVDILCYK